eukprot:3940843-Amphidinium_carterae.1
MQSIDWCPTAGITNEVSSQNARDVWKASCVSDGGVGTRQHRANVDSEARTTRKPLHKSRVSVSPTRIVDDLT